MTQALNICIFTIFVVRKIINWLSKIKKFHNQSHRKLELKSRTNFILFDWLIEKKQSKYIAVERTNQWYFLIRKLAILWKKWFYCRKYSKSWFKTYKSIENEWFSNRKNWSYQHCVPLSRKALCLRNWRTSEVCQQHNMASRRFKNRCQERYWHFVGGDSGKKKQVWN